MITTGMARWNMSSSQKQVQTAMKGHIQASRELIGRFNTSREQN
jgi:hypothetical protein